jgi:hypothetical protein
MDRRRAIELGALVLLAVGMPIAYLSGDDPETTGLIIVGLVDLVLLFALFERGIPRFEAENRAGTLARDALIFSIVSLVLLPVFWLGLPIVIGAVALELGLVARDRRRTGDEGKATAAAVIGALAVVLSFVALLVG